MKKKLTWHDVLAREKKKLYFIRMMKSIEEERISGIIVYPPKKDVFNAFRYTEFNNIKVVILGQDPYVRPGQAHGLAFSVPPDTSIPPSLLNIYKELEESILGFTRPSHGCLSSWAHQGVLLLNTVLTVREGQSHSHSNLGWEIFTDKVIHLINIYCRNVVFLLWGSHAKKKCSIIDKQRHYVLRAQHPSPLSANRGFLGCNHFFLTNRWLNDHGKKPINWMSVLNHKTRTNFFREE